MAGYIGSKAVLLSTTAAVVTGDADIGGGLTVDTNTLFVDAANNRVGIGTATPQAPFVVSANGADGIEFTPSLVTGANLISHFDRSLSVQVDAMNSALTHQFYTAGSERMRIDSSGNVGIGTSSPQTDVEILSSSTATLRLSTSADVGSGAPAYDFGAVEFFTGDNSGIGPRVASKISAEADTTSAAPGGELVFYTAATNSTISESLRINSDGYILVGTSGAFGTTGTQGIRKGSAGQLILASNSGGLYHQVPGNIYYTITTSGGSTSDATLKTNVATLENALSKVCRLRGVSYEFIDEPMSDPDKGVQIGVIAQEVEAEYSEAVVTSPDGIKSVRYEKLIAPLIEAIKQQQARIDALEARIVTLEGGAA